MTWKFALPGIRPGEKLFEELFLGEEHAGKTQHPRIFIGQGKAPDWFHIESQVSKLEELAQESDVDKIYRKLKEIVPEFKRDIRRDSAANHPIRPRHAQGLPVPDGKIAPLSASS